MIDPKPAEPAPSAAPALTLAIRFHDAYERLAPSFGYETRTDTRQFDPESKNGRLMVAVCGELLGTLSTTEAMQPAEPDPALAIVASLGAALRKLSFAAQTTGGTAGPDAGLQEAIAEAERALSFSGMATAAGEAMQAAPPAEPAGELPPKEKP